jgi:hypothetical protein
MIEWAIDIAAAIRLEASETTDQRTAQVLRDILGGGQ